MNLAQSLLNAVPIANEWVQKPFVETSGFSTTWWVGEGKGPVTFCSFTDNSLGEVARAQIIPHSVTGGSYSTYSPPPSGATEIDLLEVRDGLRGRAIGRAAVSCIRAKFPRPYIALSLNDRSDDFWRSLDWAEHAREDAAEFHPEGARPALLFVQSD